MKDLPITLVDYRQPEKYKETTTEFIVFVNKDKYLPIYDELYQVYKNNPQFRKLSMVSPTLSTSFALIYGWKLAANVVSPQYVASSKAPYAIQIGPIIGSLIRRSALERIDYEFKPGLMLDSVSLSMALWESGNRIYIAPDIIIPIDNSLDNSFKYINNHDSLQKLFKREMIG